MSQTTSVAKLKASLSHYLARVKGGEDLIVTERGRPIARILAYQGEEGVLDELVRAGLAQPGTAPLPTDFWELPRPLDSEGKLLIALVDEREEGR